MTTDEILDILEEMFPDAHCELEHRNAFELLVAVVLSAQTTDAAVNKVTPALFEAFKTPQKQYMGMQMPHRHRSMNRQLK